jgi:hypothetical protein
VARHGRNSETVTSTDLSQLLVVAVVALLAVWYLAANREWYRLLREQEAGIHIDPIAEPVRWARTGSSRFQRGLHFLLTPANDDRLELWRRRTVNRGIAGFLLGIFSVVAIPLLVSATEVLIGPALRAGGAWNVISRVVPVGFIIGYFLYRLALAVYRFGNGASVRRTEFLIGIYAIVAYILFAEFMRLNPIGGSL